MLFSRTLILPWLWLFFACIFADECGENMVKMATVENSRNCILRINTEILKQQANVTSSAIEKGLKNGEAAYETELVRENNLAIVGHANQSGIPKPGVADYFKKMLLYRSLATSVARTITDAFDMPQWAGGDAVMFLNLSFNGAECTSDPVCDESARYRSYDGSCNNLKHPKWGMAGETYSRLLLPNFEDGISTPRKASDGSDLPSGRLIRTTLIPDKNKTDSINSLAVMQWGQLISHDIGETNDQVGFDGLSMDCCSPLGGHLAADQQSSSCLAIDAPASDYFYSQFSRVCLNLPRSNATYSFGCKLGPGENIVSASNFMDGSVVYGSSEEVVKRIRDTSGGRLRVNMDNGRAMLPKSTNPSADCGVASAENCFVAGDDRVNQNPQLTALQLVLLREHNRVAAELQQLQPMWDDETLFQETRRIVAAIIQHITYNELLPIYLGNDYIPLQQKSRNTYNPDLNPTTINSFSGAAYRAFHGLVQDKLQLVDESRCPLSSINLMDWFLRPSVIETPATNLDLLLRGVVSEPIQSADQFSIAALSDIRGGDDITTKDIVRGRERGLPPYNSYRELCGLSQAETFDGFQDVIRPELVQQLKSLYKDPQDVDLFVGGFLEDPVSGALVGPTFRCILGEQFFRFKFGDRFFYKFTGFPHSFTEAQIAEIEKTSLSRLLCDNGDNISHMQHNSFHEISEGKPLADCDSIPKMSLKPWKTD